MDDVSSETPLRPGMFEGLDADACARLRRSGIDNLGELASAGPLDVARASEIALSRVARWQALANRLAGNSERLHTLHPSRRFSPAETAFFPRPLGLQHEIEALAQRDAHAS